MSVQPRENAVPCVFAKRRDTRHTTFNNDRVCDDCRTVATAGPDNGGSRSAVTLGWLSERSRLVGTRERKPGTP